MSAPTLLRDEVQQRIGELKRADIMVGIPSYNNAKTIGHVVRAVTGGLEKYFHDYDAILVNSDGGSTDGTSEVVAEADHGTMRTIRATHRVRQPHRLITAYHGIPGKGSAFRTMFEIARRLDVKACAVVDSDLRSITPEWLELLLGPVLHEGYDYVCPLYSRHKYDGTITNSIVYPLVRSLYGRRIRQPIGGDFGFSGRLAGDYLKHDVWESDVARFGIDIWMTTTALVGDYKVCQAYLGAKIHDAKDPSAHLSAMLAQVTSALFDQMEVHESFWMPVEGSEPVAEFGFRYEVGLEPVNVNRARMVSAYEQGVRDFGEIYGAVLQPDTATALQGLIGQAPESFHMPVDLWVRVVYEFAAAAHHRRMNREHLLRSLTPLYLGRTASWVNQAAEFGAEQVEGELDALCQRFEALKPHLRQVWQQGG